MSDKPRVLFHTGGPAFHPVQAQAECVRDWLADRFDVVPTEGNAVFDRLDEADLVVIGGLHWTGGPRLTFCDPVPYQPPNESQRQAWRDYVASGRPVCGFHGGIGSYDDWPEFARLLGFAWVWGVTSHTKVDHWTVHPRDDGHRVTRGLKTYELTDELYFNVAPANDIGVKVHADAPFHDVKFPMLMTGGGGRCEGAGRTAYIANGHDMRAFECKQLKTVFANTFHWLLNRDTQ